MEWTIVRSPAVARLGLALSMVAVALGGCDKVPSQAVTRCEDTLVTPGAARTDILFVVDDSASMANAQAQLQANFQAFVDRLAASPVRNDFQIGVTTTSVSRYSGGSYPTTFLGSQCSGLYPAATPYPAGALVSVNPAPGSTGDPQHRQQSTTGTSPPRLLLASSPTLVQDFTQDVYVGVCGSAKEQGLDAARLALEAAGPGGANAGFLRPGARLAVIIVSDDDDCSDPLHQGTANELPGCTSYPVQPYVDYFQAPIQGEARPVVFGLIVAVDPATGQPAACTEPGGGTVEHAAVRYRAFADAFGASALVDSICKASFHDTLVAIAGLIDPGQVLPLESTPADWRLLAVAIRRASGQVLTCSVGDGTSASDVVYLPPEGSSPARLQFQGSCLLQQGDAVDVKIVCAS